METTIVRTKEELKIVVRGELSETLNIQGDNMGNLKQMLCIAVILIFGLSGCAVIQSAQIQALNAETSKKIDECFSKYPGQSGKGRDSVEYWQCHKETGLRYAEKYQQNDSALMEIYYDAQLGVWSKVKAGELSYAEGKQESLVLKDGILQELERRQKNREQAANEEYMNRMRAWSLYMNQLNRANQMNNLNCTSMTTGNITNTNCQ